MSALQRIEEQTDPNDREIVRRLVLGFALFGVILFGSMVGFTFLGEEMIGRYAKRYIGVELEEKAEQRDISLGEIVADGLAETAPPDPSSPVMDEEDTPLPAEAPTEENQTETETAAEEKEEKLSFSERLKSLKEKPPAELATNFREKAAAGLDVARQSEAFRDMEADLKAAALAKYHENIEPWLRSFIDEHLNDLLNEMIAQYIASGGNEQNDPAVMIEQLLLQLIDKTELDFDKDGAKFLVQVAVHSQRERIVHWEAAVKRDYDDLVGSLIHELRLFGAINLLIYSTMTLMLARPSRISMALVTPSVLMLISNLGIALLYIFFQDWYSAILNQRYWGWLYILYVGIFLFFLIDWIYWEAQVTLEIISQIIQTIGSLPLSAAG